jgi:hypothetical protein
MLRQATAATKPSQQREQATAGIREMTTLPDLPPRWSASGLLLIAVNQARTRSAGSNGDAAGR